MAERSEPMDPCDIVEKSITKLTGLPKDEVTKIIDIRDIEVDGKKVTTIGPIEDGGEYAVNKFLFGRALATVRCDREGNSYLYNKELGGYIKSRPLTEPVDKLFKIFD
jgi:hypothetical protein